ncbi:TPA: hypothetical protein N0F65_009055 [Lagenidium giganteum]|uniref:RecA family profile 1 domain-containing protein n=1 Tax=Lagenidium giganteum TaxID=4803 RepID=A0AAV2YEM5_9STRA|nr:TPA: hypothetical protein N0F65_009055 [Lagenidium giganteum]
MSEVGGNGGRQDGNVITTALQMHRAAAQQRVVLSTGCTAIDEVLDGGFRSGLISEVCGEASAGKTQLCLQLLLQCRLPGAFGGLDAASCYICTEGIGSMKRLHELAQVYAEKAPGSVLGKRTRPDDTSSARQPTRTHATKAILDGIYIEQVYEVVELLELLQTRLPLLLEKHGVRLVVIDSIAALFRLESTHTIQEASERSRSMFYLANCIRILCAQYNAVFVISNQVTGNFAELPGVAPNANAFKPALGMSWSHCVNQRCVHSSPARKYSTRYIVLVLLISQQLQMRPPQRYFGPRDNAMVAGNKHTPAAHVTAHASSNNAFEIRSGMSVQDLKQLTAQRAERQRVEYWEQQARYSPRTTMCASSEWSSISPPTRSSALGGSPPRSSYSSSSTSNYGASYGSCYGSAYGSRRSPGSSPPGCQPEKMFVTCGGQVVSFMEGVVNAPQLDFLPDMLSTL